MEQTLLLSSSLSSRSHATTDQSSTITPNVVPHLSFRYRRRSRHRRRPPVPISTNATDAHAPSPSPSHQPPPPSTTPPARPKSPRPLHRIRTRIAVFDRSSRQSQPPSTTNFSTTATTATTKTTTATTAAASATPAPKGDPVKQPSTTNMSMSASTPSSNPSPTTSAVKDQDLDKENESDNNHKQQKALSKDEADAKPRRMLTNTSALKKRPLRRLAPPPRSLFHERLLGPGHGHHQHAPRSQGETQSASQTQAIASVTDFLRPLLIPMGYLPEVMDTSFRPHTTLLRKLTVDDFDLNRYLFVYKPVARVSAVLAHALLSVTELDHRTFPMSAQLRSAVVYVNGNSYRNLYVMTYASQLKSTQRSRPATEAVLPAMVLEGAGLSDTEVCALDYAQELSSPQAVVTETTRRKLQRLTPDDGDGRLERVVTAACAYSAFLSSLTSVIDVELTHSAIQYASQNLDGLPWKSSAPISVDFFNDDLADFGSAAGSGAAHGSSKYRPKRERLSLTRNYDRHGRDRSGGAAIGVGIAASAGNPVDRHDKGIGGSSARGGGGGGVGGAGYVRGQGRYGHGHSSKYSGRARGLRRVSQFLSAAFSGGGMKGSDVTRATEEWMRNAGVPPGGQLFDINDELLSLYGFHPFYFSTAAVEREATRRALLFGVKELLFSEVELSKRLKFILCYVLSSGKERRRITDCEHSFEKKGGGAGFGGPMSTPGNVGVTAAGIGTVLHNGHSINSVYSHRTYDSLSIMSAHAAFLACKYGAKPAELVAAVDESRVRSAMDKYSPTGTTKVAVHNIGFPLSRRDCAAVLIAHALVKETPAIGERDLQAFADIFGYPGGGTTVVIGARSTKSNTGGGSSRNSNVKDNKDASSDDDMIDTSSRVALVELISTLSMWHCIERYATGSLAFDIDFTSNMAFGLGRAEKTIGEFVRSAEGKKIGLSLGSNDGSAAVTRARSDSRASPTTSLRKSGQTRLKRMYNKRTSSALNSGPSAPPV